MCVFFHDHGGVSTSSYTFLKYIFAAGTACVGGWGMYISLPLRGLKTGGTGVARAHTRAARIRAHTRVKVGRACMHVHSFTRVACALLPGHVVYFFSPLILFYQYPFAYMRCRQTEGPRSSQVTRGFSPPVPRSVLCATHGLRVLPNLRTCSFPSMVPLDYNGLAF